MLMMVIGLIGVVAGILIGVALTLIVQEWNEVGEGRREPTPRISSMDLFELPEPLRSRSSYPPTTTSSRPPKEETRI